jgi:hypothetical protein
VRLHSEIHAELKLITNGTKNIYKTTKVVKLIVIGGQVVHEPGLLPGEPVSPHVPLLQAGLQRMFLLKRTGSSNLHHSSLGMHLTTSTCQRTGVALSVELFLFTLVHWLVTSLCVKPCKKIVSTIRIRVYRDLASSSCESTKECKA